MKILYGVIGVVVILAGAFWVFKPAPSRALDSFASCLADKKVTMYGAEWCPHCQNQKKLFGDSFRLVPYVECPDNPSLCLAKGINGYPTWIFPDGSSVAGEQSLKALSEKSTCPLQETR